MTRVKCYSLDTGKTETVATFDLPELPHSVELWFAGERVATFVKQDHSTDHVYYVSEENQ